MATQSINFGEVEFCDFNGNEVEKVIFNGDLIWEYVAGNWVDGDDRFYYTGVDANGVLSDEAGYNGNPVEYYIGRRQKTENADGTVSYTYVSCNGLNPAFYNGYYKDYEFFPNNGDGYDYVYDIPWGETLIIPNRYNKRPITKIMDSAFQNGDLYDTQAHTANSNQSGQFTSLVINEGIKEFDDSAFEKMNVAVVFPKSTRIIGSAVVHSCYSVDIPEDVETIDGVVGYENSGTCTYRAKNATLSGNGIFDYFTNVVFESTVEKLSGAIFYSTNLPTAIVFKHPADANITLSITAPKSAITVTMYTDNTIVKNYDWAGKNYTVTFKSLSEWSG